MAGLRRLGFVIGAWALLVHSAPVLADSVMSTDQDVLACLEHRARPPAFPHGNERFLFSGALTARLKFEHADKPPVLAFVGEHATLPMRTEVESYLDSHRLPCLPKGRTLTAWQSFTFSDNGMVDVMPPVLDAPVGSRGGCLVAARYDRTHYPAIDWRGDNDVVDVIVALRFVGQPTAPPEVRIVYSNAGQSNADSLAMALAADYRLPCRQAADPPYEAEQAFRFMPDELQPLVMRRLQFSLEELLAMSASSEALDADFDLDSMACPFSLSLQLRRPTLPNPVFQVGPTDIRRQPLLEWLSVWTPRYSTAQAQRHLFNTALRVEVPCGRLKRSARAS